MYYLKMEFYKKLIIKLSLPMLPVEIRMVRNESYSRNNRLFTIIILSICLRRIKITEVVKSKVFPFLNATRFTAFASLLV